MWRVWGAAIVRPLLEGAYFLANGFRDGVVLFLGPGTCICMHIFFLLLTREHGYMSISLYL
jgi:hypothetical protein